MKNLQNKYNAIVNEIVIEFCKKHNFEVDYNIDQEVYFFRNDCTLSLSDILFDLFNNLPVGMIEEWHDYMVKWLCVDPKHDINLKSWSKGCPRRTDDQYEEILRLKRRIEFAENQLKIELANLNRRNEKR